MAIPPLLYFLKLIFNRLFYPCSSFPYGLTYYTALGVLERETFRRMVGDWINTGEISHPGGILWIILAREKIEKLPTKEVSCPARYLI